MLLSIVDAVIFVVDSADIDRLNIAKAELAAILKVGTEFSILYAGR